VAEGRRPDGDDDFPDERVSARDAPPTGRYVERMPAPKLAVFDLDGTLIDSRRSIASAMASAFETEGLSPPSYDETRRIVGLSLEPALAVLAPDLEPTRYAALGEAYKLAFVANRAAGFTEPLYDGALDTLRRLKDTGWLLGVATGKARRGVLHFLETHNPETMFDAAFCADDGPGKPDPHMLRLNMSVAGVLAADTIMIGDTSFDMAMARAADAYAQGVTWGFHTPDEIAAGGAHHLAHDFPTLSAELERFLETEARDGT
jgi:phosphoglycolate phosphatase